MLRIRHTARDVVDILGPGRRSVVWVQGCSLHCPGCMVPEMWNPQVGGELVDPVSLAGELLGDDPDTHLTVSGGEPTEQPEAVAALLAAARSMGRTTWVYSGRTLDELLADDDEAVLSLLAEVDVLVDGRYEQSKRTSLPYRGSANQRVLHLTDAIPSDLSRTDSPRVSLTLDSDGGLVVIGVPPPGFLARLEDGLENRGIRVNTDHRWV